MDGHKYTEADLKVAADCLKENGFDRVSDFLRRYYWRKYVLTSLVQDWFESLDVLRSFDDPRMTPGRYVYDMFCQFEPPQQANVWLMRFRKMNEINDDIVTERKCGVLSSRILYTSDINKVAAELRENIDKWLNSLLAAPWHEQGAFAGDEIPKYDLPYEKPLMSMPEVEIEPLLPPGMVILRNRDGTVHRIELTAQPEFTLQEGNRATVEFEGRPIQVQGNDEPIE